MYIYIYIYTHVYICIYMYCQKQVGQAGPFTRLLSMRGKRPTEYIYIYIYAYVCVCVYCNKQVGQAGPITRLLSLGGKWPTDPTPHPTGDHLMAEVPTHIAPQYDYSIDQYVAYNKPLSIAHWLQTTKVILILFPHIYYSHIKKKN